MLSSLLLQFRFCVSFHCRLVCDRLRVSHALVSSISHELFIFFLSLLLQGFHLRHLIGQVLDEQIHHGNDATRLLRFLGVGSKGLWWRRRCSASLHQTNAGSCNSSWSFGWGQSASHVHCDAILLRKLTLWRSLVELWIVEFLHAILCESNQFMCSLVRSHLSGVVTVLLLPDLSALGNFVVKILDALHQGCKLLSQLCNQILVTGNGLFQKHNRTLQLLLLVISNIKVLVALFNLGIIIPLFLGEECDHVVDHANDFAEINSFAMQSQQDGIKTVVAFVVARLLQCGDRL